MASTEHKDAFLAQLEQLAIVAAKSTSPAITSRWIAASDERVKALVFKKLDEGHTLAGVTAFPHRRAEYAVVFAFDRAAQRVNLIEESFCAIVDLVSQKVADIMDPYMNDEGSYSGISSRAAIGGAVPFAMRIPSNARNVVVSRQAGAGYRAAEQQFFRQRGIQTDPSGPMPGDPGLPGRPGRPGGWPGRPGFDLPERGNWGTPSPATTYIKAWSPVATDEGTDTTTGNPPDQTDDVENDGHTDYVSDPEPFDHMPDGR
jgi:hypothetical protein